MNRLQITILQKWDFFGHFQTQCFGLEVMMKKEEMHNKKPHEFSNITFFLSFQLSNCTEERKRNFFPCTYFLGQQKDWERIKMQNTYLFHRKFITTNKVNSGGQTLKLSRLLCCTVSKKIVKLDFGKKSGNGLETSLSYDVINCLHF